MGKVIEKKPDKIDNKDKKTKVSFIELLSLIKNFFLASQSTLGVDVGSSYIKLVQLQRVRGNYTITNFRVRAFPSTVKDNPQEKRRLVKKFIEEFVSESPVKAPLGRIALWGGGVYIFSLAIPAVSEKELKSLVTAQLKKKLPFQVDLSSIIFSYFVTDKFEDERGIVFHLTCIAMDKYVLEENVSVLKESGIRPVIINAIPDALGNMVGFINEEVTYVAVLDMGAKESVFSFYKKGALQFSRQIPIGGYQFTQAIMKAMNTIGMSGVTEESAEKVKRQCGVPLEDDVFLEYFTDFGVIKGAQISVALRPVLERFNTEVTRTINYYYRTFRINQIECLYLTGGSSRLKNIDKFLEFNLQNLNITRIEKLNPLEAVKTWSTASFRQEFVMEEAAPHMSAACGLCIKRGGKANLLPPREKLEQKINFITVATRVSFFLVLFIILGIYSLSYGKYLLYKRLQNETEAEITKLSPMIKSINDYMAMKGILTERKSLLANAIGPQPLWWGILKELSNITPEGVALRKIRIVKKSKGRQIHISGEIFAEYTSIDLIVTQYYMALEDSPYFAHVRPPENKDLYARDPYSPVPKANFEIVCDLVY